MKLVTVCIAIKAIIGTLSCPELKLISSYVKKQIPQNSVAVFSCWNRQKNYMLLTDLHSSGISINLYQNFSKIVNVKSRNLLVVSDANCKEFHILLRQAEELKLLKPPTKWLVLSNINDTSLANSEILLDSNFALATIAENHSLVQLVFKFARNDTNLIYSDLAKFSLNQDFEYYNSFGFAPNRSNLMGTTITVSYVATYPNYTMDLDDFRNRHIDGASKLSFILTSHMLEMLNCTQNNIQRKAWAYKKPNSTFYESGMLADLQNGIADIGGTVAFYEIDRMAIMDYLSVTTPSDLKFIFKAPPLSYVHNLFTLPFQSSVWYCLYLIVGCTIFVLYVIVYYENKHQQESNKQNNVDNIKSKISDVIMVEIGAITQQGSDTESKSISGRLATFITFLALMFLYTAYSANIVVLLQSTSKNIRSARDLLESKIGLGVEDIVYAKYVFENQQEPIRKAIYEKKISPRGEKPNFLQVKTGIQKVRDEFYAFHVEITSGYKVVMDTFQEHEKCGLREIDYLNNLWPSLSVKKNSPYTKVVKVGKLYEVGIRHRLINRLFFKKPQCTGTGGSFASVGLIDAYFPIVVFFSGVCFAVTLLLCEVFFKKCFKQLL